MAESVKLALPAFEARNMAASVVIIDDVAAVRVLLRTVLETESDFFVAGEAATMAAGEELVRRTQPDAVVIDLSLQPGGAPEAIGAVKGACARSRLVVFSAHPRSARESEVLAAGADAYVQKGGSLQELIGVLRRVLHVPLLADTEPDPLAAVAAHGMLGTAAVLQGAASMLTHSWDRLPDGRRAELFELLRVQVDQLRDGVISLPAVIGHRVLNELVGLFELVERITTGEPTHRHRIELFEMADSSLPRILEILKGVVAGLPPDVVAHLDSLHDTRKID
jgi:CheY-like chemotaxis protein